MSSAFALQNPGMRADIGFSRVDITPAPDAPINNWAAGRAARATGVHLPLTGTVMYLEHGDEVVVLISLDLGWWRTDGAIDELRASVAHRLALGKSRVAICLTHTHAGPAVDPVTVGPQEAHDVARYLKSIELAVGDAAQCAREAAEPALLEWARGHCGLARARDQWSQSEGRYLCGFAAELPADDTLMVGRVVDTSGAARGVIVNYACHPTSLGPGNTLLSPDYVGVARELVERLVGAPMLFLQGASGELAPRRQYQSDRSAVTANGEEVGYAVLSTLAGMLPPGTRLEPGPTIESGAPLGQWTPVPAEPTPGGVAVVETPIPLPPNSQVGAWRSSPKLDAAAEAERRARQALVAGRDGSAVQLPVTVWLLGAAVLVAQPGEAYSQLQTQLRAMFPATPVVVVNLANGRHHGYVPPAEAYSTDRYQVWQTALGPGSLEAVVAHCARQITQLTGQQPAG